MQGAEAGEGEGVDLHDHRLADLDEADIEIGDQGDDLERALVRRDDEELLAGRDHLTDGRHRHLLDDAVDGRDEAGAGKVDLGLGDQLAGLVDPARGLGELVLVVGDGLGEDLELLGVELGEGRVGLDQLALIGGERGLGAVEGFLGIVEIDLGADLQLDRLLAGADAVEDRVDQAAVVGDGHLEAMAGGDLLRHLHVDRGYGIGETRQFGGHHRLFAAAHVLRQRGIEGDHHLFGEEASLCRLPRLRRRVGAEHRRAHGLGAHGGDDGGGGRGLGFGRQRGAQHEALAARHLGRQDAGLGRLHRLDHDAAAGDLGLSRGQAIGAGAQVGPRFRRVEFDDDVAGLHHRAVLDADGGDLTGLKWLDDLGRLSRLDLALRHGMDIEMADEGP